MIIADDKIQSRDPLSETPPLNVRPPNLTYGTIGVDTLISFVLNHLDP